MDELILEPKQMLFFDKFQFFFSLNYTLCNVLEKSNSSKLYAFQ